MLVGTCTTVLIQRLKNVSKFVPVLNLNLLPTYIMVCNIPGIPGSFSFLEFAIFFQSPQKLMKNKLFSQYLKL